MIEYVTRHIWDEAIPKLSPEWWILHKVLRLPQAEGFSVDQTIFGANQHFQHVNHLYYDRWNSHRADLVAKYVDPPGGELPDVDFDLRRPQSEDPCEWILTTVMGFTMKEIIVLRSLDSKFKGHKQDLPLLRDCCLALSRLHLKDELLARYHRTRYLLGRYYVEYIYHERLIRVLDTGVRRRKRPKR